MKDFFRTANRLFPIYHEETFMRIVEWQYTQQTCDDAARWASINIILSLAYEYRLSNSLKPEKDRERAWMYFKNAISVFTELTLRRTDLLSVQALLGMVSMMGVDWKYALTPIPGFLPARQFRHAICSAHSNCCHALVSADGAPS